MVEMFVRKWWSWRGEGEGRPGEYQEICEASGKMIGGGCVGETRS
jgi:hypothetical protein